MTPTPPTEKPIFVFEGRVYTLEHDMMAEFFLDRRGLDIRGLCATLFGESRGKLFASCELLAAFAAHNFDTRKGETVPSTEEWVKKLDGQPEAQSSAFKAVGEVLIKVGLATKKETPPTPPASPETPTAVQ